MQILQSSTTGTIRDCIQDSILIDRQLNMAAVIDGTGPAGESAAIAASQTSLGFLRSIFHITGPEEVLSRLQESFGQPQKDLNETAVSGKAAIWIHRGRLAVFASGTCIAAIRTSAGTRWKLLKNDSFETQVTPEMLVILGTEGFCRIAEHQKIQETLDECIYGNQETLLRLSSAADSIYEGDDRSLLLIETANDDLKAGEPHELELFEHYNREFKFPLWAPLSLLAAASAGSLFLIRRIFRLWQKFSK